MHRYPEKRHTILVDMDGIVVDLYPLWLERYNHDWDDNLTMAGVKDMHLEKWVKPECGKRLFEYLNEDLYTQVQPIPGALDTLARLNDWGYRIAVATALPFNNRAATPEVAKAKLVWLERFMPFVDQRDIHITFQKHHIPATVFIDDWAEILKKYAAYQPKAHILTIDYPHNREVHHLLQMVAKDWQDPSQAWKQIEGYIAAAHPF